jgi:hypothetical protein
MTEILIPWSKVLCEDLIVVNKRPHAFWNPKGQYRAHNNRMINPNIQPIHLNPILITFSHQSSRGLRYVNGRGRRIVE